MIPFVAAMIGVAYMGAVFLVFGALLRPRT
jgi:hypothetical protein